MDYCRLKAIGENDYRTFNVPIAKIVETFNVLDGENAGRVMTGEMSRDIIGTYLTHKVTFFNAKEVSQYDALIEWLYTHSVDDYVYVDMAHEQTTIKYKAYYTSMEVTLDEGRASGNVNKWNGLEVTFISMEANLKPQ